MKISDTVEYMRKLVSAYDEMQSKKRKLKQETEKVVNFLKGGKTMKFGTIIGIVVGAIALIAAGAAAMYFYLEGLPCKCKCCDEGEDDLYDDFPDEEIVADADEEI